MEKRMDQVTREITERITPTMADRAKMQALATELERKVAAACEEFGVEAVVRVEGSVAKDTWLREEPDLDIFMRMPTTIPRKALGKISLEIARKATEGSVQIERFAEHPYLEAFVNHTRVNIVPCYIAKPGEWLSATDRTPFHTDYINEHLDKDLRGEVRLLKKFMKGIGAYGAEIRVGGFSGYLCELLVLRYGAFAEVLKAFARHTAKRTIDLENFYALRERELQLLFPEPLVVVDPVDKGRNVASAVHPQRLHTSVAASRAFLKAPRTDFFYPPRTQPLSSEALTRELENRGSTVVFLTFEKIKAVPDVLWGQLHRTRRALRKLLELSDFKALRDAVWTDDNAKFVAFLFELEQPVLPVAKKHLGPPLEREKECENFLAKYASNGDVVAGPFVDEGRWVVELRRKFTDAKELLKTRLKEGGRDVGVAERIAKAFRESYRVLVNREVLDVYVGNSGFAEFLTEFLRGKPFWLENS